MTFNKLIRNQKKWTRIVRNQYNYGAFGEMLSAEETVPNRFRYAGEQYDPLIRQYYLRARFYNPVIGRFTQEDSYHGDGLNLYAYCKNNPLYYVDPSGHEVRAAAEKNLVNKAVEGMNKSVDRQVDAMLGEVYGEKGGSKTVIDYSYKFEDELINFNVVVFNRYSMNSIQIG